MGAYADNRQMACYYWNSDWILDHTIGTVLLVSVPLLWLLMRQNDVLLVSALPCSCTFILTRDQL